MVSFVRGIAVVAEDAVFSWTGVDGLVGASRVSFDGVTSPCCVSVGWKISCGIGVGDRYRSASSIAAAASALTLWNSVAFGPIVLV